MLIKNSVMGCTCLLADRPDSITSGLYEMLFVVRGTTCSGLLKNVKREMVGSLTHCLLVSNPMLLPLHRHAKNDYFYLLFNSVRLVVISVS